MSRAMDAAQAVGTPWYRQFWPWFLIALPGATVAACMFTIWLALTHPEVVLHAPPRAETALRPYADVRSAYPGASHEEAAGAGADTPDR